MPHATRRILLGLAAASLAPAAQAQLQAPRRSADGDIPFPAPGRRPWAEAVPRLGIALMGGENEVDRLARFDGYRALLEQTFGVPARLYPAGDYAGVMQAFGAKQVEIASLGSSAYAGVWLDTQGNVEPLVVPEQEDGSIGYLAVMLARADSGIASLEDMRGRSLAWADPNSASGYLIPRAVLRRQGVDPEPGRYFGATGFAGGHEQAVVAVLQKQYDACCTWASGQGEEASGFTRGNLRAMVEKNMLRMSDIRIIWRSEPIPTGPITIRADLPDALKNDMKQFLLALPRTHPDIYRQISRGEGAGYREARHADYQIFIDLRQEEAAARRRRR
ncbi:phosphate/phosphite/phosphonate ABC transporter substrate-binding protein [Teichococcus oryzae]|uniref:Phosphate/phosphite/phosphonate ABC transporter substrate-binding protein n=1 Tax=Teichococcus oryzae TaxID=1608942 RepID=A0A5B2TK94_9PROT|nr:phosphate/phosphite/phosphonate ABC transporter substrate-binding protein [Pseudoroseomonas oryzae]KAA2214609.1 phosphate/phosphite/phosphonate ABC transporter substrate-binding protein [Pseudoroseomonas oryzae]